MYADACDSCNIQRAKRRNYDEHIAFKTHSARSKRPFNNILSSGSSIFAIP